MPAVITKAASAATVGAAAGAMSGWPPDSVLLCAMVGALLSIWGRAYPERGASWAWAFALLGQYVSAVAFGLGGAAAVAAVGPSYEWSAPLATAPSWIWALGLASGAQVLLPMLGRLLARKAGDAG